MVLLADRITQSSSTLFLTGKLPPNKLDSSTGLTGLYVYRIGDLLSYTH